MKATVNQLDWAIAKRCWHKQVQDLAAITRRELAAFDGGHEVQVAIRTDLKRLQADDLVRILQAVKSIPAGHALIGPLVHDAIF